MALSLKPSANLRKAEVNAAVLTLQGSKKFIKKVVPLSVSFILYQRVQFPDSEFKSYKYDGVTYKTFSSVLHRQTLKQVRCWVNGAMDALQKNYLRELYLLFYNANDPDVVYESYKFQFKYMGDDVIHIEKDFTKKGLHESTNSMIAAIESLNVFTKFTEQEVNIRMAVTYYEDVTPITYTPPFFNKKDTQSLLEKGIREQSPSYLLLGLLKTGFHTVKCRGKGDLFAMDESTPCPTDTDQAAEEPELQEEFTAIEDDGFQSNAKSQEETTMVEEVTLGEQDAEQVIRQSITSPVSELNISTNSLPQVPKVLCVCRVTFSFDHIEEVQCSQCFCNLHCACLAYLYKKDAPENFVCPWCDGTVDTNMSPTKEKRKRRTHIYRLTVAYAYLAREVPHKVLDTLMADSKQVMLTKMTEHKILVKGKNGLVEVLLTKM